MASLPQPCASTMCRWTCARTLAPRRPRTPRARTDNHGCRKAKGIRASGSFSAGPGQEGDCEGHGRQDGPCASVAAALARGHEGPQWSAPGLGGRGRPGCLPTGLKPGAEPLETRPSMPLAARIPGSVERTSCATGSRPWSPGINVGGRSGALPCYRPPRIWDLGQACRFATGRGDRLNSGQTCPRIRTFFRVLS